MATRKGGGALNNIVVFQQREAVRDEGGGTSQDWVDKFETAARLLPRLGSEADIAARTQGIQPYTLIVRSETRTRNVTPSWRAKNKRTGVLYEIQSCANPDDVNLHQIGNIDGLDIEVRPHFWPETVIGNSVAIVRPSCRMTIVPGSISTTAELQTGRGTVSFQAIESR